ncbi:MAG: DUF1810 domain-containing protein [Bradyrhizobiaceae bacterium]|nr:MAG: DUF1810 domain-containing protein [Bradyrhizobiaceae bacterium]
MSADLDRFVEAQAPVYPQVITELRAGKKRSHWMWFVFPQFEGLGHSAMAQRYAITSRAEAALYLDHPILGPRLRECTGLVNAIEGKSVSEIFGYPDDLKFCSSMTLFAHATCKCDLFVAAVEKYFGGRFDEETMARIA